MQKKKEKKTDSEMTTLPLPYQVVYLPKFYLNP